MDEIHKKIDAFFSPYREIKYHKNQLLLFPGEISDRVFYLVSGRVSIYEVSYKGDEIVVFTFVSQSYFPMATVINGSPSRFFYKADTEAKIRTAPSADFNDFIRHNDDLGYYLLSRAYGRFEHTLEKMIHLISGSARERLMFELAIEYKSFGVGDSNKGYIEASEASIASRAGLSRETVSREMKYLKQKGIVELKDHRIYLMDIPQINSQLNSSII
jgi:CRP/FNR family transcriptional regulator